MKKSNPYLNLNLSELHLKQQEHIKDLLTSRLSSDFTTLTSATNLQNLLQGLKTLARMIAIKQKAEVKKEKLNDNNK